MHDTTERTRAPGQSPGGLLVQILLVLRVVVGTGVDPVTYRFSGDRSAN